MEFRIFEEKSIVESNYLLIFGVKLKDVYRKKLCVILEYEFFIFYDVLS